MFDRPTEALWGIGTKTARKLADRGITTVRELAAADPAALAAELGPALGPWYVQLGRGIGRAVVEGTPWVPRSRSHETTFQENLTDWADVRTEVAALARKVAAEIDGAGRPAVRVAVKVRFAPFSTYTRSATLDAPTTDGDRFAAAALDVLELFPSRRPVRLLGVRAEFAPREHRCELRVNLSRVHASSVAWITVRRWGRYGGTSTGWATGNGTASRPTRAAG